MSRSGTEPSDRELLLAILARLDRIERAVSAGPLRGPAPLRLTRRQAAQMLGVSTRTVSRYVAVGLLVELPKGPRQKTAYYDPANVNALATSEDHAREWVARRKYVSRSKPRPR